MGKFADVFVHDWPPLPMWLAQKVMHGIPKMINGDIMRFGLPKPDHKIFESHPLVNSQLLHYLGHGDVTAKGNVERLDGKHVVFKDGSRGRLLCTTPRAGSCRSLRRQTKLRNLKKKTFSAAVLFSDVPKLSVEFCPLQFQLA